MLLLIIIRSGLLSEISLSVCMSKFTCVIFYTSLSVLFSTQVSTQSLSVLFSRTGAGLCIYHLLLLLLLLLFLVRFSKQHKPVVFADGLPLDSK